MVTQKNRQRLITRELLRASAARGTTIDTRGLDFVHPTCEDRAVLRAQAEGLQAYHLRGYVWMVPSGSEPNKAYTVISNGKTRCDCPAGQSGQFCKHVAVIDYQRRQDATREAAAKAALALILSSDSPIRQPATISRLEDLYN